MILKILGSRTVGLCCETEVIPDPIDVESNDI